MSTLKKSPDLSANTAILEEDLPFFCFYKNQSPQIQVIRLIECRSTWERIIFPQERLLFEATSQSQLEVQLNQDAYDLIPCIRLKIDQ